MRYVRPFSTDNIEPGGAGPWLISEDEDMGIAARVRRGANGTVNSPAGLERYLLLLEGHVSVRSPSGQLTATGREILFIPASVTAEISADPDSLWLEVEGEAKGSVASAPMLVKIDESRFQGSGFAYQPLIARAEGASAMRLNLMQVQPGSGSPDFHIHAFTQIYLIEQGEMTVDVGRARLKASPSSLVVLPAGSVHRNFNASQGIERHISLLVPEPQDGDIFDYAVVIKEEEAQIMTELPADAFELVR